MAKETRKHQLDLGSAPVWRGVTHSGGGGRKTPKVLLGLKLRVLQMYIRAFCTKLKTRKRFDMLRTMSAGTVVSPRTFFIHWREIHGISTVVRVRTPAWSANTVVLLKVCLES